MVMKFAKLEMYCAHCVFAVAHMYIPSCMCTSLCGSTTVEFTVLCILIMYIRLCTESEAVNLVCVCVRVACVQALW